GSALGIEVTLDITHSFMGDLQAYLTSPSGRRVLLFSGDGGQYNDFHNLTFSDSAERSISTIGVDDLPYSGSWRPEEALATLSGEDLTGIWTLSIADVVDLDEGTLNSWSLSFSSGERFQTTVADGTYQFNNVNSGNYN